MKKQALTVVSMLSLSVMLAVVSVYGNAFDFKVRANIPFDFVVGNETLPSGTYTVEIAANNYGVLAIRGTDNRTSAFVLANTVSDKDIQDNSPKLIFNRYGDQYFLSQVWSGARLDGLTISKSPREREHLAQGISEPESVFILALNR